MLLWTTEAYRYIDMHSLANSTVIPLEPSAFLVDHGAKPAAFECAVRACLLENML